MVSLQNSASAQDKEKPSGEKSKSEFETSYFGVRLGWWYQPALDLRMSAGGQSFIPQALIQGLGLPTRIDVEKDLGVKTHEVSPTDFLTSEQDGTPEGEVFVDTEWVSLSVWGVAPFRYQGDTSLTRSVTFDGLTFSVTRPVHTTLDQFIGGIDIKINLLNNRFVRLSPVIAGRVLGLDWQISDPVDGFKGSTEDSRNVFKWGRWQLLPYPEFGAEVRVGYRSIVEVDAKVTAFHIFYGGFSGTTALAEAGITVYPLAFIDIENLGVRLGGRYYYVNVATDSSNPKDEFNANMKILGANLSLIARF